MYQPILFNRSSKLYQVSQRTTFEDSNEKCSHHSASTHFRHRASYSNVHECSGFHTKQSLNCSSDMLCRPLQKRHSHITMVVLSDKSYDATFLSDLSSILGSKLLTSDWENEAKGLCQGWQRRRSLFLPVLARLAYGKILSSDGDSML